MMHVDRARKLISWPSFDAVARPFLFRAAMKKPMAGEVAGAFGGKADSGCAHAREGADYPK
jgi:hypothetical protein